MSSVNEPNILFQSVGKYCQREVITATAGDPLIGSAAVMREHGVSSLVVYAEGIPAGIVTDRDLRNKVVAQVLTSKPLLWPGL